MTPGYELDKSTFDWPAIAATAIGAACFAWIYRDNVYVFRTAATLGILMFLTVPPALLSWYLTKDDDGVGEMM